MNLPNKLTTLRVIMIPFFVFFLLWQNGENRTFRMIALALFIIASLTDLLDGKIARKYNLVTNFGKFMDPLADKCLVMAALCWFVENGDMVGWVLAAVLLSLAVLHTIVGLREGTIISAVLVGMSVRFFSRWTRRLAPLFWEKEKLEKARRRRLVLQESYAA